MGILGAAVGAALLSLAVTIPTIYLGHIVRVRTRERLEIREAELAASFKLSGVKEVVLRYPSWAWKGAAALLLIPLFYIYCFAILIVGASAGEIRLPLTPGVILGMVCITLVAFAFPWVFFVSIVKVAYEVGPSGLRKVSPWAREFFSSWDEIRRVTYNSWIDSYVVHTSKGVIRVRAILEGISFFLEMMTAHLPKQKLDVPPRLYPGLESK